MKKGQQLLLVILLCMLPVEAAVAQNCQEVINTRQSLMKKSGAAGRTASAVIKGAIPFDLTKAREVFAAFADDVGRMPTLSFLSAQSMENIQAPRQRFGNILTTSKN